MILIIDDDIIARKAIQQCVQRTDFLTLAASCDSVKKALKEIEQSTVASGLVYSVTVQRVAANG